MQNRKMQIKPTLNVKIALNFTANASKMPASVLPSITFILNVVSENGIIFIWMGLFSTKMCFLNESVRVRVNKRKYIISQVSIVW